jgi:hypothetical protein
LRLITQYPTIKEIIAVPIIDPDTAAISPLAEITPVELATVDELDELDESEEVVVVGNKVLGISGDIILL